MQQCPICETEFSGSVDVCPECGGDDRTAHVCDRCGEKYVASRACPACGSFREPSKCERHPDRVAPGRCVICGKPLCEKCAVGPDRATLCDEHRDVRVTEGWAEVYTTTSELEAQLVRDNLRAEGVDARTFSQRDTIFSVDLGELSIVRVLVPAWSFQGATELIREHTDPEGEVTFACPSCGEAFDVGSEACQICGAVLT